MEDEEIVLACTKCHTVYMVALLDGSDRIAAHCPFCGEKETVTDALIAPLVFPRQFQLIPGGKK